jgi:hypothetical protein
MESDASSIVHRSSGGLGGFHCRRLRFLRALISFSSSSSLLPLP